MYGRALLVVVAALALAGTANAAQLIDRNATHVVLRTNIKSEALLTYNKAGKTKHVLIWGAINAAPPVAGQHQVKFALDYSGGYGKYHTVYWKTFGGTCGKYDGPKLAWLVTACAAPDGSYWAVQSWRRTLPNFDGVTTPRLGAWELHLSHWTGATAKRTVSVRR